MDHRESLFDFRVPSSLIAQRPLPQRDRAGLMLLSRNREGISHSRFNRLPELLAPGTLLVLNDTRVVPARLEGHLPGGRPLEALLTDEGARAAQREAEAGIARSLGAGGDAPSVRAARAVLDILCAKRAETSSG